MKEHRDDDTSSWRKKKGMSLVIKKVEATYPALKKNMTKEKECPNMKGERLVFFLIGAAVAAIPLLFWISDLVQTIIKMKQ
jgi:hypothetical protein